MESAGLVLANHYFFLNSQLPNLILEGIMTQILSQNTEQFDNVFTWDSTAFHIFTLESVILYVSCSIQCSYAHEMYCFCTEGRDHNYGELCYCMKTVFSVAFCACIRLSQLRGTLALQVSNSHRVNVFIKPLSYLWCSQLYITFELLLQFTVSTNTL